MEATGLFQALQLFYFFFVLFEIKTCAMDVSLRVGKQGPYTFGNFHKRLNGSVFIKNDSLISSLEADGDIVCASLCVMHKLCLAVNFGSEANSTGKVQCELLNYGATDYQNYLVKKEKFFFMRLETICSKSPCRDGICIPQPHNLHQPYKCGCPEKCAGNIKCNALGMEDGRILDSQITASSAYAGYYYASHKARLNSATYYCWLTDMGGSEWLQIALPNKTLITGVATQGCQAHPYWVTFWVTWYQMSYSDDGNQWTVYKENGIVKDFNGNADYSSIVTNLMTEPFAAKFVRILPISGNSYFGLRVELYGC